MPKLLILKHVFYFSKVELNMNRILLIVKLLPQTPPQLKSTD
jgi:hypothetical protein